jgi:polyisoprenoid-binding protein YceI
MPVELITASAAARRRVRNLTRRLGCLLVVSALFSRSAFAEVQRFRLNPDESQITTKIADPFGGVVEGTFRLRQGEARGDPDRLAESASVSLVIDTASYNSNIGLRDQDVQEYYLEVKQHPVIRFNGALAEKAERTSQDAWQITVKGRLDLHGVQREIVVPVRLLYQQNRIVAQGSFRLSLAEFNIAAPRLLFLKSGNQAEVNFRLVGERQP